MVAFGMGAFLCPERMRVLHNRGLGARSGRIHRRGRGGEKVERIAYRVVVEDEDFGFLTLLRCVRNDRCAGVRARDDGCGGFSFGKSRGVAALITWNENALEQRRATTRVAPTGRLAMVYFCGNDGAVA